MHLGCCSTFGKRKKHSPAARVFLRLPKVSRHPSCMDHAILHGKPFGIPLMRYISRTVALYLMHSSQKRLAENFLRTTIVAPHVITLLTPRIPPLVWYSGNTQYNTSAGDNFSMISQAIDRRKNL